MFEVTCSFVDNFVPLFIDETYEYMCSEKNGFGIATRYGLDGSGIESRGGARFSAPVQTGPVAHPSSCTFGYRVSFPGGKAAGA